MQTRNLTPFHHCANQQFYLYSQWVLSMLTFTRNLFFFYISLIGLWISICYRFLLFLNPFCLFFKILLFISFCTCFFRDLRFRKLDKKAMKINMRITIIFLLFIEQGTTKTLCTVDSGFYTQMIDDRLN